MGSHRHRAAALLALVAFILPAGKAFAGPTALTQAYAQKNGGFPIKLTKSGSYIFQGDILPTAGVNGIEVSAPYVTIDLNGFLLHGGNAANAGITTTGNALTVKNGTIGHFKNEGVFAPTSYVVIENMRVVENGLTGVHVGRSASITGSTIAGNGQDGILVASGIILGNIIESNLELGIEGAAGYGNNTLYNNNGGGTQVTGPIRLQPNACVPACP